MDMDITPRISVRCGIPPHLSSLMAFAPTLEIEYNSISCDQAVLLGNYTPNGHSVARFTLYVGLHPERLLPFSQNSQYYGGAQGNYFLLSNLTPGTTYYVRMCLLYDNSQSLCVEGSFTTPLANVCPNQPYVVDIDGNTYNTVQIGNQCWMRENLKTTTYSNGTPIARGYAASQNPAWYYPQNDSTNKDTYGLLYNWYAVMNNASATNDVPSGVQGVCPRGWHVPSSAEWTVLTNYLEQNQYICDGNSGAIAKALCASTGWTSSNIQCSPGYISGDENTTGFSILPAGYMYSQGQDPTPSSLGSAACFWTTTQNGNNVLDRYLTHSTTTITSYSDPVTDGNSVRCIADY